MTTTTCFDVKYDNSVVHFYDEKLKEIGRVSLTVQCHRADVVDASDGKNKVIMTNNMCLCYDATNVVAGDVSSLYPWYVVSSAVIKAGMSMNNIWAPAFVYIDKGVPIVRNFSEKSNIIVVPDVKTSLALKGLAPDYIESMKLPSFKQYLIMPLQETIIRLFPIYTSMTLMRMMIYLKKRYTEDMERTENVMVFLFDHFLNEFNKVSKREACSFADLHMNSFQNTFKTETAVRSVSRVAQSVSFYATKKGEPALMIARSGFFSSEEYGDIPWFLASDKEQEAVSSMEKVKHWNGTFVILPGEPKVLIRGERILYIKLIIFPQMRIGGYIHEYGSMIGVLPNGHLDFRGKLFDDMTPREEFIIASMVGHFANDTLQPDYNPIELYSASRIPGTCRIDFIEEIRRLFIKHNGVRID
jgi:hypothetical protein